MLTTIDQATSSSTRSASGRNIRRAPILLAMLAAPGLLLLLADMLQSLDLDRLCIITTFCVAALLAATISLSPRGIWSVASVYLFIFGVFHFGVAPVIGFGLPYTFALEGVLARWLYLPATREALVLALVGFSAVTAGAAASAFRQTEAPARANNDPHTSRALLIAGFGITALCIAAWFFLVIQAGGIGLLSGSYLSFLAVTSGLPLPYVYHGLGLGMTMLAAAQPGIWRRIGIGLFVVWCLFALPLGLRGEVLFPTAAALVIQARQRIPLSGRSLAMLVIAALFMIATVREVRQAGLQGFEWSEIRVSPFDALVEMGASLRPVVEVIRWHESGDDYLYGASYWAPLERAFYRLIPDLAVQRIDAEYDERLSNILVQYRVGFIGFSPVAEAYRNGGTTAVVLVMFLTGMILGWLDRLPLTPESQVLIGVVLVPLLIQVRNSFAAVPFQILSGALVALAVVAIAHVLRKEPFR